MESELESTDEVGHFILDNELGIEIFDEALAPALWLSARQLGWRIRQIALLHACLGCEQISREAGFRTLHAASVAIVGGIRNVTGIRAEMWHPLFFLL